MKRGVIQEAEAMTNTISYTTAVSAMEFKMEEERQVLQCKQNPPGLTKAWADGDVLPDQIIELNLQYYY